MAKVTLVSFRLKTCDMFNCKFQVADQIWICENQKVTKWEKDILAYKDHLKAKVMKESNKDAKNKGLATSTRGNW